MPNAPHLCGLILAAGESSRMGTDKALLPWPPQQSARVPQVSNLRPGMQHSSGPEIAALPAQSLLSAAILTFKPLTSSVIVVAGNNANRLAPIIETNGAILARNPNPERGQFSSLQIGLREALARDSNAVMITPVDCPPLSASSLELLRTGFDRALARGLWAVAPENNGKHGHPLLANRDLIDALLAAPVTSNAREVLHANASRIQYIPVPDTLAKASLNTPADYAALAPGGSADI
jgi:molybdenum cofactor cytidylyltransferase